MTKIERDDVRDLFAAEIGDSEIVEACIVCISIGVRRSSYPSFIWEYSLFDEAFNLSFVAVSHNSLIIQH